MKKLDIIQLNGETGKLLSDANGNFGSRLLIILSVVNWVDILKRHN